ncbi:MAG: hypothetical protein R3D66_03835 [Alphaproteobacteria bacterium]
MKDATDKITETGSDQYLSEENRSEKNKQPEKKKIFRMLRNRVKTCFGHGLPIKRSRDL